MLILFSVFFMVVPVVVSVVTDARPGAHMGSLDAFDTSSIFFRYPWTRFMLQQALLLGLFFLNYFVLVPRFIIRRRAWLSYILLLLGLGAACFFAIHFLHRAIDLNIGFRVMPMRVRFLHVILHMLMAFVISLLWRFLLENHRLQQLQQQILQEKTQAELMFLQSQINPHFLLNTLNTLYSLSVQQSTKTPELILKLADILKFTLYEAGRSQVSLHKELAYIRDYVEIQSLRLHEKTSTSLDIRGDASALHIHPMLLIPFIENAFKHGVSTRENTLIEIRIWIEGRSLSLEVRNAVFVRSNPFKPEESGVGLDNVRKRLEMLYPGHYSLDISNDNSYFTVRLTLLLHHDEMPRT